MTKSSSIVPPDVPPRNFSKNSTLKTSNSTAENNAYNNSSEEFILRQRISDNYTNINNKNLQGQTFRNNVNKSFDESYSYVYNNIDSSKPNLQKDIHHNSIKNQTNNHNETNNTEKLLNNAPGRPKQESSGKGPKESSGKGPKESLVEPIVASSCESSSESGDGFSCSSCSSQYGSAS